MAVTHELRSATGLWHGETRHPKAGQFRQRFKTKALADAVTIRNEAEDIRRAAAAMRKIFPFDPIEAQHRAELARRTAAKVAIDAERAERRRLAGEKAAAELRNLDARFSEAAALEADTKRKQRMAAAELRRSAQQPERLIWLLLFEDPIRKAIFEEDTTDREIEKLSRWFERLLRSADAEDASDADIAASIVGNYLIHDPADIHEAMCWLIWNTPAYRETLSDQSVKGVGFVIRERKLYFVASTGEENAIWETAEIRAKAALKALEEGT